jgi:hypothetical protein
MSSRKESLTMKFRRMVDAVKRAVGKVRAEVGSAIRDAVRVFRIAILLHSAKDFPSALKLYGIEDSSQNE